ncbi:ribonuclease H-like protein, partial [Polyporus arcularius HHB13444]
MPKASKPGFYAVARGRVPGVYSTWDECQQQVSGFLGNKHQKFPTLEQARAYLAQQGVNVAESSIASSSSTTSAPPPPSRRTHGSKPYEKPSTTNATPQDKPRGAKWAALTTEVIADESGWDVVYSDGACKGNGKVGSVAGIGVWWGANDPRNLAERCPGGQTNNRAELIAIVRVLETTPHTKKPLLIKTDSKYSISC